MAEHKDEGLMDKILTLVAPPLPTSSQKGRGGGKRGKASQVSSSACGSYSSLSMAVVKNASSSSLLAPSGHSAPRHTGMQNHSYCDACGDGGSLLCCDNCPTSFHFNCCEPPVDPKNIPSGDWLCRRCSAKKSLEPVSSLLKPLVDSALSSNPLIFNLPYELQRRDILPGSSRKELKQARLFSGQVEREAESKDVRKSCYMCNKGMNVGRMASCDFCPLMFHLDCLEPPLTIPPTTVWMCPVHPNTKIPGFDHPRLSERLKALEKSQSNIPYHTIKADFIECIRKIPPYRRTTSHHNRRVADVPGSIKSLYAQPIPDVSQVLPVSDSLLTPEEDVLRWRLEEEANRRQVTACRQPTVTRDQDEWTRGAIQCQLQDEKPLQSRSVKEATPTPLVDVSMLLAAQQLLELSGENLGVAEMNGEGKREDRVGLKVKDLTRLNGIVRQHVPSGDGTGGLPVNGSTDVLGTNGDHSCETADSKEKAETDKIDCRLGSRKREKIEDCDDEDTLANGEAVKRIKLNGNGVLSEEDRGIKDEGCGLQERAHNNDGHEPETNHNELFENSVTKPDEISLSCTAENSHSETSEKSRSVSQASETKDDEVEGCSKVSVATDLSPNHSPAGDEEAPSPCPSHTPSPHPSRASSPRLSRAPSPHPSRASSPHPSHASSPHPSRASSPHPSHASSPRPSHASSPRPSHASSSMTNGEDMETSSGGEGETERRGKNGEWRDQEPTTIKPKEEEEGEERLGEEPIDSETKCGFLEDLFVPDLSQLNSKIVQLLALQRISQLLVEVTESSDNSHQPQVKAEESPVHRRKDLILDSFRQQMAAIAPHPPPSLHPPPLASLLSASAVLCPLSGTALVAPLNRPVISIGLGSEVDINLLKYGHCNFVSPRQACIFYDKTTKDYELINYSEHGTVVDGVLYSCDFSDKGRHADPPRPDGYFAVRGFTTPLHRPTAMDQAARKVYEAKKYLGGSKEAGRRAVEKAIRMAMPVKDDLSLAEEMSKCEGLMTRTGLKRVAAESAGSLSTSGSSGALPGSTTFLSIPLSKTKRTDVVASPPRKSTGSSKGANRNSAKSELLHKQSSSQTERPVKELPTEGKKSLTDQGSVGINLLRSSPCAAELSTASEAPPVGVSCDCRDSLTNKLGSTGKGWEGTATLTHGSRLRFGCVQFILSLTGQPGHSELIQALSHVHGSNYD